MSDTTTSVTDSPRRPDELSDAKRALLARKLAERAAAAPDVIPSRDAHGRVPLSAAQEEIWMLEQLAPGLTAYNLANAWHVRGAFDEAAFQQAINVVVARHESLRASFTTTPEGAEQTFAPATPISVRLADRAHEVDSHAAAKRTLEQWATTPFNLNGEVLLRAGVVRVSADERYVFIMTHHLATDAVSRGVLFEEIGALYANHSGASSTALPPVRVPFGDYTVWERSAPVVKRLATQTQYWVQRLQGAPDALELPLDHPRGAAPSFVGGRTTRTLAPALLALLKNVASQHNATPFMVLMSAFSALLSRYSGQDDVVIGVPTAGRTRPELAMAVGLYTNTLGIRAQLPPTQSFAELLQQLRTSTLDAFENQEIPYARVVAALRENGRPAHAPLFRVMLAMQNHGAAPLALAGLQAEALGVDVGQTKFDLTMLVSERDEGLRMTLEYRKDLYDHATAERMLAHLERLLIAGLQSPSMLVTQLPLMDADERRLVTETWNATRRNYPATTLAALLEQQRLRTPNAPAVSVDGTTLSYEQLHTQVDRLAASLNALGVQPGVLVAVAAERSIELVTALLAVVKSGGAYVPLDPEYPADRLAYMLEDSAPQVLLTQRALFSSLPTFSGPTLFLDTPDVWPTGDNRQRIEASPTDPAYMIYTSGSTGRPKGALNAHRGIVNRLLWMQEQYRLTSSDVVLQKTPCSFDVSVWEFFWPLLVGARLAVAKPGGHRDPHYLLETIANDGVTTLHFVPSMLRAFLAAVTPQNALLAATLRHMMCSGEALGCDLVAGVQSALPHIAVHNLYGPTECAVDVSHWTCTVADAELGANVPIGRPVANTQLYVLDTQQQPLPVGVPGELYLAGVQVGMGYHRRPELTAERFVTDMFSDDPTVRMYRTGDRARWRADGVVEYLGRLDDQIKLRGFRIELGEIGSAMQQHPAIADAVAVLRAEREGMVVGYAVPDASMATPLRKLLELESAGLLADASLHELPNGLTVFHRNRGETEFLFREIFEGDGYLRHGLTVGDGDVVFDVGANIGMFTVFAGTHARGARVYAFEPIPPVFDTLKSNASLYDVSGQVFNCGLGSRTETVSFTFYPHNTVLSGRFANVASERAVVQRYLENDASAQATTFASMTELLEENLEAQEFACSIRTLSDVVASEQLDRIDLLKIDVEKAEWDVLQGIDDVTWPKIRQVVIEVHDENGRLQLVLDVLHSKGFICVAEEESMLTGTGLFAVYARRVGRAHNMATGVIPYSNKLRVAAEIIALLAQQLPDYMVPSSIVLLNTLPLTASGKLDRRALPAPDFHDASDAEPPDGPIEEVVASVWRQALNVPFVGRSTNFFTLGGHSLIMTTMIAAMAKLFRMQLPLRAAFEAPTVAGMAASLQAREAKPGQLLKIAAIVSKLQSAAPASVDTQPPVNTPAGPHAEQ